MKTCKRSIDARARRLVKTAVKLATRASGGSFAKLRDAERLDVDAAGQQQVERGAPGDAARGA